MSMNISISVDKFIFELIEIPQSFFLTQAMYLDSNCNFKWDQASNNYYVRHSG
jgi:hypothetical protein